MKKKTAIILISVASSLILAIWLVRLLPSRPSETGPTINDTATTITTNETVVAVKPVDVSIETMIEEITTLFEPEPDVMGKQHPERYGEEIGLRILKMTNDIERTELARRYTDVLMSMPLAAGTYSDRLLKLYNIVRMIRNWDDILYQIQFDPKIRIELWLTLLGNSRDAAEDGWKADTSEIAVLFAKKNAMQKLARMKLARNVFRGLYVNQDMADTRRRDFIKYACIELRNVVKFYNLFVSRIISHLPPNEQARTEKECEERVRKMEIGKLLEAMEKDAQK